MAKRQSQAQAPGIGVDSKGGPVVDPTANVLDLVAAAVLRQDDLRKNEARHVREVIKLRAEERRADIKAVQQMQKMQEKHNQQLRKAESRRINAIRAVDVAAGQQSAEVSTQQAATLAAQVAASAETLRNQVAAAATAATVALAAALEPIQKDIADLRRAQYEAQGQKTQVVETRSESTGSRQFIGLWIAAASVTSAIILGATGVAITLLTR